ncbi:MAG: SPOR domain-containing protein [Treponema sp.]|nr:SPOR domain-containing protein [Treponema sp.]
MKRFFIVINLLFLTICCFSQQNMPNRIIGRIPDVNSTRLYQIQVGAFISIQNAENAYLRLQRGGFTPVYEKYLNFTRVMITGIPASQVSANLIRIKQIGFNEVIIREDNNRNTISEKWEITTPGSTYLSFEFNHDNNYIAIENSAPGEEERIHFGEYTMPSRDVIQMDDLGVLRIEADNSNNVNLSFSPIDEPERADRFTASKAQRMPESAEIDLFCRTWRVVNCSNPENIGNLLFISNAGTYFFTTPDGESNGLSQWRWYGDTHGEFEYSHDNWGHYGRVRILELSRNSLKIRDPGFLNIIPGYSSAGLNVYWELVPMNR